MEYPVSEEDAEEMATRLTHHAPKGDQTERYEALRTIATMYAGAIMQGTPKSREQALALTKLEESLMWAIAAIARRE